MNPTRQQCGTFEITLFTMLLLVCSLTRTLGAGEFINKKKQLEAGVPGNMFQSLNWYYILRLSDLHADSEENIQFYWLLLVTNTMPTCDISCTIILYN